MTTTPQRGRIMRGLLALGRGAKAVWGVLASILIGVLAIFLYGRRQRKLGAALAKAEEERDAETARIKGESAAIDKAVKEQDGATLYKKAEKWTK